MKQETDKEYINVYGARVHNLKNIDVSIPRDSLTVITGLSGSGKSSLAFDTIFAEGQRRYIETFSAYARNFLGNLERPDVDKISGLSPVISIEQKTTNKNPRSTVGTVTEVYDFLRLLYARAAEAYSYVSGEKMVRYTEEQIIDLILNDYTGILHSHRRVGSKEIYFIVNDTNAPKSVKAEFPFAKTLECWNPQTGDIQNIQPETTLTFGPYEGLIIRQVK